MDTIGSMLIYGNTFFRVSAKLVEKRLECSVLHMGLWVRDNLIEDKEGKYPQGSALAMKHFNRRHFTW